MAARAGRVQNSPRHRSALCPAPPHRGPTMAAVPRPCVNCSPGLKTPRGWERDGRQKQRRAPAPCPALVPVRTPAGRPPNLHVRGRGKVSSGAASTHPRSLGACAWCDGRALDGAFDGWTGKDG
eukprot:scaffold21118_cov112-Isochrysis_galbana.AAC.1